MYKEEEEAEEWKRRLLEGEREKERAVKSYLSTSGFNN